MWTPEPGDVVSYSYLWWREREAGEESGRKTRPCVVVVAVRRLHRDALRVAVAPITHAPPGERPAVELPQRVKRQLQLDDERSWIVCDEVNQFEWPGFDLDLTPSGARTYGRVPDALLEEVKRRLRAAALRSVNRDE